MLRKLLVPLCLALFAVSGCNCGEPPKDLTVTITAPANGASLTMADDIANDVGGLQIDVAAATTNFAAGASATLLVDGVTTGPEQTLGADGKVTFSRVTLSSGSHVLKVTASEEGGSATSPPVSVVADDTALAPSLEIVAPLDGAMLNAGDDLSASEPGMQVEVQVRSVGLTGGVIRICAVAAGLTGANCKQAPGQAVAVGDLDTSNLTALTVTLPDGEGEKLAAEHEAADGALTVAEQITVTVDTVAPSIAFVVPAEGATLTAQSVDVQLSVSNVEVGQTITIDSDQADANPVASVAYDGSGTASLAANLPLGAQVLTARVADRAGNEATATRNVTVNISGCDVLLTDPSTGSFIFNIANSNPTGSPATGQYTITGATTRCALGTARFTQTVNGQTRELGTAPVDAAGRFGYRATFADGEINAVLHVTVEKAGVATGPGVDLDYFSDFTPPALVDAIPPTGNLFVVHESNPHLAAGDPGYVADADPAAAGGQVDANLTVTGVGTVATAGFGSNLSGSVVIQAGAVELVNQSFNDNAQQSVAGRLGLDEGFSGDVLITLKDSANNSVTATWHASVSTVPLPALTITMPTAGTINVFRDMGGNRDGSATVQASVTFTGPIPPAAQVVMCSNAPGATGAPCATAEYSQISTPLTASGTSQFYAALRLPAGIQDIMAEMADAVGGTVGSAPVHLVVDTKPPRVVTFVSNEDVNPHDGVLSGAELPVGSPATFTVTLEDVEDGRLAKLQENGADLDSEPVAGGTVTFTLTNVSEGPHTYKVVVTDAAGNPNESASVSPAIANPEATLPLTASRIAPTITRVAPTEDHCNSLNDADETSSSTCEVDFTVLGGSATRVDFSLQPASAGTLNPSSVAAAEFVDFTATARFSLQQTTTPVTLEATVYDAAGNWRQATYDIVLVDTVIPSLTIVSPAPPIATVFTQVFPFTVATDAEPGQEVRVTSLSTGAEVGSGTVVAGSPLNTATFNVSITGANQVLSASVTDAAGNPSAAQTIEIHVNLAGCDINFTTPGSANPIFNATSAPGGLVHIAGYSTITGCENQQIDFSVTIGGVTTPVGSTTTDGNKQFAFDYTFPDGSLATFTALSAVPGSTANSFTAITDITSPTLEVVAPVPNAANQLFVVAKTGNLHVKAAEPGYLADLDDTTANGQVLFAINAAGAGSSAGVGTGRVQIVQGTSTVFSQQFSDNGAQTLGPTVNLTQAFAGSLVITATDHAGNSDSVTMDLTVDVVPPPAPAVVSHLTVDERHCDLALEIQVPHDNGPAGSLLTWELGYSTSTRLGTAVFDDAAYDNPALTEKAAIPAPGAPGTVTPVHLAGLPPLNTFFLAPRAFDGVGNRSLMAFTPHDVLWTQLTTSYSGSYTSPSFGSRLAVADVNMDSFGDVAVSAPAENSNTGSVTVYFGPPPFVTNQKLTGSATNAYFGSVFTLTDLNGDGFADLVAYNAGAADVYFGSSAGIETTAAFKFTGDNPRIVLSLRNMTSDGVPELAIGAPASSGAAGKLYIFFSRTDWSPLISGGVVDVNSADIIISGVNPNTRLTNGNGVASVPDVDGDEIPEVLVGSAPSTVGGTGANTVFLFSGATLMSRGQAATTSDAVQAFTIPSPSRFGYSLAALRFDDDDRVDLIFGDSGAAKLYVATQKTDQSFNEPVEFASGSQNLGWSMATADLNGDDRLDLLVGSNDANPTKLRIFWSSQSGLRTPAGSAVPGVGGFSISIATGDVTNDGTSDFASGESVNGNGDFKIYY